MLSHEESAIVLPTIQATQLIWFGLLLGTGLAGLVVCGLMDWQGVHSRWEPIPIIGVALGILLVIKSWWLPQVIVTALLNRPLKPAAISRLPMMAQVFQTQSIIRFAILESAVFTNLIFFFGFHHRYSLITAALALFFLALAVPHRDKGLAWIGDRLQSSKP